MTRSPIVSIAAYLGAHAAAGAGPSSHPAPAAEGRKARSYVRSTDGATMVEIERHQFVNRKCLGSGVDPLDPQLDGVRREMARKDGGAS